MISKAPNSYSAVPVVAISTTMRLGSNCYKQGAGRNRMQDLQESQATAVLMWRAART